LPEEPQAQKTYNRVEAYLDKYTTYGGTAPGNIFYVDSGAGANTNDGLRKDRAFGTIEYAHNQCTANNGDIIFCLPGHDETIDAAADLDIDTAGVTVVFLGEGQDRAKITFGTTSTADMDIDAASITFIRPRFVAAVDALAGPIDINSTDFTIVDGLYEDATNIDTTDAIVATSGATRLKIHGLKYQKGNEGGTTKESFIQLNGVDDAELTDIHVLGEFDTGIIENVTVECLNILMRNLTLINTESAPSPGMVLDSNCDGAAENVLIRVASGTTYVSDLSDINWYNSYGTGTDGAAIDDPIGTATATGPEGKIDTIDTNVDAILATTDVMHTDAANYLAVTASMSSATWNTVAAHEIAVVTGMVRMRVIPEVTASLTGATTTIALGYATTVAAMLAATTGTALDATEIWQHATAANNLPGVATSSIQDFIINSDDVGYTIAGGSATAGQIIFHIWWEALNATGAVTAGAGGAF